MGKRSGRLAAVIGSVLLVATPVRAQDPTTHVAFGPITFDVPVTLGTSVNITTVPATAPGDTVGVPYPPRLVVTIYGERDDSTRVPRVGEGPSVLTAFRVADAEGLAAVAGHIDVLRALLEERPDLTAFTTDASVAFPFLPQPAAAPLMRARSIYVDTPMVSGIRYLTAFEQAGEGGPLDSFPFTSTSVLATFQGLSSDGIWYLSVVQDLETSLFPADPRPRDIRRAAQRWDAYLAESIAAIEAAAPGDFTPSLDAIDALVGSLRLATAPASEPSPSPAAGAAG